VGIEHRPHSQLRDGPPRASRAAICPGRAGTAGRGTVNVGDGMSST